MRRFVRPLLNLAILAGLILAAWPVGQTLYGVWNQRALAVRFASDSSRGAEEKRSGGEGSNQAKTAKKSRKAEAISSAPRLLRSSAGAEKRAAKPPWRLTRLSIPDINLETFVVQGMDDASLRRGPGHDPNSSLPGEGNCVVAGHRNVYGSFFYRLDELLPGALITLENRDGRFDYIVDAVFVTPASNLTILQPPPAGAPPVLTLITCTLPHSNNRIILQAKLSSEL